MFRYLVVTLLLLIICPAQAAWAASQVNVAAGAAILMDARTGQVLYAKNAYQPRPPASTTKVATALMALQTGELQGMVNVSEKAARTGESSMNLIPGEKLTLEQLLYGALLKSGNDACAAIAEGLAGSEKTYMDLVNNRIKVLGAQNTSFVNSNGLPAPGHLSSAYDLALLTRYARLDPVFCSIVQTRFAKIRRQGQWVQTLKNRNKLLWEYPPATGVKTGTTNEAGACLIASAEKNGRQLISVVLHSSRRYEDSIQLLEYGFNEFTPVEVIKKGELVKNIEIAGGEENILPVIAESPVRLLEPVAGNPGFQKELEIKREIRAPVEAGEVLGEMRIKYRGRTAGCANLVAGKAISLPPWYSRLLEHSRGMEAK